MDENSYKISGVDVSAANDMKASFFHLLEGGGRALSRRNSFAAIFDANLKAYDDPVLVFKSEEPGSKQLLALERNMIESVCADMVNHLVNDCVVCGATPVAIQDVIVCGSLDPALIKRAVGAIAKNAQDHGCFLSGGETSEQPGVLPRGAYVLSSSIVGVIERTKIVDGLAIVPGNKVIALESSGIHTNGYSLIRRFLAQRPELATAMVDGRPFIDVIMDVHRSYYGCLKPLFARSIIKGAAHITGGGIRENLNRILPQTIDAEIDLGAYRPQAVFGLIRKMSGISDSEMLRTFNLGVGMAIVVAENDANEVVATTAKYGVKGWVIGETVPGKGNVKCHGEIPWDRA